MLAETTTVSDDAVLGFDENSLCALPADACVSPASLHADAVAPFLRLREHAAAAGFDLRVVSGYRGFDRQLAIWNGKADGSRVLLDQDECPLDASQLDADELVDAILRWSALPGLSRHHWGTDFDVIDAAAIGPDYRIRLTVDEWREGGPFHALGCWFEDALDSRRLEGFFRPYDGTGCAVACEPWHLSNMPLARRFEQRLFEIGVAQRLDNCGIALWQVIAPRLDDIMERYAGVMKQGAVHDQS